MPFMELLEGPGRHVPEIFATMTLNQVPARTNQLSRESKWRQAVEILRREVQSGDLTASARCFR